MIINQCLLALRKVFNTYPEVEIAYLFGSQASGTARATSDVDVGVFTGEKVSRSEAGMYKLRLIDHLVALLHQEDVDVVIMDYAPVALNFEIIKHNSIIFMRDPDTKITLEQRIMSRYLDSQFHVHEHNAREYQQILAGNYFNK
jgi:predicted nucleotidyltransferase